MTATDDQARNLVLITADSLRADHCGFVDGNSELTPAIDRLASEGIAFTDAIAPGPRTPSSVPVLFTGEFMADDEAWTMGDWQRRQRRIGQHMTRFTHLSERLQRQGYDTAAFTANPWTTHESNFAAGFDEFFEISADSDDISAKHLSNSRLFKLADSGIEALPGNLLNWSWKKEWFSQWPGYFDLITAELAKLSEPFFVWIFLMDSHQPYVTPRRYRTESSGWETYYSILRYWHGEVADDEIPPHARQMIARTYRDAVRSVDAFVETLTNEVNAYDPVTVFHSDHGEAFGEHGNFGHEQTLYEENLHVPFVVHNAGSTETVTEQVSLRSLSDVLAALRDPAGFDPDAYTTPFAVSQTENNGTISVRTQRWKYVTDGSTHRLYDHTNGHGETTDASDEYPDVVSSLGAVARRHTSTQHEKGRVGEATQELLAKDTQL